MHAVLDTYRKNVSNLDVAAIKQRVTFDKFAKHHLTILISALPSKKYENPYLIEGHRRR